MRFSCAIPKDMRAVIDALATDADVHWQDPDVDDLSGFDELDGNDDYGDGFD